MFQLSSFIRVSFWVFILPDMQAIKKNINSCNYLAAADGILKHKWCTAVKSDSLPMSASDTVDDKSINFILFLALGLKMGRFLKTHNIHLYGQLPPSGFSE